MQVVGARVEHLYPPGLHGRRDGAAGGGGGPGPALTLPAGGAGVRTHQALPCTSRNCCYQKMELDERLTVIDPILAKFLALLENI